MLRPFLVVGVGGSGGKTLRGVRKALQLKLEQEHWRGGWPDAWQFLHIDSPISQDGLEFPAPLLPKDQYLSLVPSGVGYEVIYQSIRNKVDGRNVHDVERALPSPIDVNVPIHMGAGAFRAIGRAISAASLDSIQEKIRGSLNQMQTGTASAQLAELTRHLGIPVSGQVTPTVIIVSSIAGGSGAGQFLDVAEALKSAANNEPWTEDMFGILFAPDVFENLGRKEIPANALGAIVETMSGFWNRSLSDSSDALHRGHGLIPSSSPRYRIGPAFPYIVGARNSLVSFGDQSDVYLAVASSLATWMTDNKVQDKLSAYTVTNYSAKAPTLTDNTGLRKTGKTNPEPAPFSSMGFGRVSLGLERFFEYGAERLARSALENILYKHIEEDKLLAEKTEEQWRQEKADLAFGAFLQDAGLDQQTQENNQVLDSLRPPADELQARMKAAIESAARGGMPQGGHSYSGWVERIFNGYEVNLPSLLGENRANLVTNVRDWVDQIGETIMALSAQTISRQGLPVTVELLARIVRHSRQAIAELEQEQRQFQTEAENLKTLITQAIQPAASMANIPANNSAVAQGIYQAQVAFYRKCEADLRETAAELTHDFLNNFLEPLRQMLSGATNTLRENVNDPKLGDGRQNPYSSWPDAADQTVPKRFKPAPNERLLIEYTTYRDEFDRLVKQTVSDPKRDAKRVVLDEFMMGAYGIEALDGLREDQQWKLIDVDQMWVPQNRQFQSREGAPQPARFDFLTSHMDYVDRAKLWLSIPGRTFNAYLDQTLADWLGDDSDKSVQAQRHTKFVKEFDAAVASAEPLVQRNQKLVVAVHGQEGSENEVLFSAVPVGVGDSLFEPLKDVLIKYFGEWTQEFESFFVGRTGAPNVRQIDVFTVTGYPVQPMTLGSVMQPIAKEWLASSGDRDSRGNFMKWRRGRPLPESLPASPDIWRQMVAGWFVAKMFGLIKLDKDTSDPALEEKGPKLSIWVDGGQKYISFPYPLYYAGIAPTPDLLGIAMESMTVALVNSYSEGSLNPLVPYQRLAQLGDLSSQDSALHHWVRKGLSRDPEAPAPKADNAGSGSMSASERKEKCMAHMQAELSKFDAYMERQDKYGDVRSYPVSWEIRKEIRDGLNKILQAIPTIEEYDEDVDFQ